jgi:hypothetical protein
LTADGPSQRDLDVIASQLGRRPRDVVEVTHRCRCGNPDVVATAPRLSDGTPFPTLYYLTCPRAVAEISTLEAGGLMAQLACRLHEDADFAARYRVAHDAYLRDRQRLGDVAEIIDVSAGGMPDRVKCLHALVAHALSTGPGVNPVGDATLALLPAWWSRGPCVP